MKNFPFTLAGLLSLALTLGLVFVIPWHYMNWGTLSLRPAETVTVMGTAKKQQQNQLAKFTAGVNEVSDDREAAIETVNTRIAEITAAVKEFGIAEQDIKTQNISVYRNEEMYTEGDRQLSRPGQWRVDNSIEITLREVERASDLTAVLTEKGATNVYGPNLMVESDDVDTSDIQKAAIEDARKKAENLAQASGRKLGAILSVAEGTASYGGGYPMFDRAVGMGGGGGFPVEPGSSTVSTSVTVVFELK